MKFIKLISLSLLILLFNCSNQNKDVIKIGAILPLTGSGAELAKQHLRGMQFAIDEINSKAVDQDNKYELVVDDDQNEPKNTVAAVNKQLNIDKVSAVITVISSASLAIAPIIDKNDIPLFANCGHPTITTMYKNVFRNFPSTRQEVEEISKFASNYLNIKNIGLLYIDDAYGKGAQEMVLEKFPSKGINVSITEAYGKVTSDSRNVVTRLLSKNPDAIYIYGYGAATAEVVNKTRELGYKGLLLGSYNFSQPPLTTVAMNSIEGSYYTVPTFDKVGEEKNADLWDKYIKDFNEPPLWNGVVEYDAIMILNKAIKISKRSNISVIEALNRIGNYSGFGGEYIFESSKDWLLPMSIAKIENSKVIYIE